MAETFLGRTITRNSPAEFELVEKLREAAGAPLRLFEQIRKAADVMPSEQKKSVTLSPERMREHEKLRQKHGVAK